MKLKKTLWSVVACLLVCVMTFAIAACTPKTPDDEKATITAIAIKETADVEISGTVNVITEIKYSDGTTKKTNDSSIEWSTSDANVATVARGVVSGKAKGTATITAKAGDVSSNACTVTVISGRVVTVCQDGAEVSSIKIEKDTTTTLTAKVTRDGSEVSGQEIEWATSDEKTVRVNANGVVTALTKGTATITATIKGTSIKTEVPVEVTWTEPVGYAPMKFAEQNKLTPNAWGYWNAQEGWSQGIAVDYEVYTSEFVESPANLKEGYEYIGMGKATFEYEITTYFAPHTYQIFYRSSDNFTDADGVAGKLHFNHDYAVSLKVKSNVSGTIAVNPYDDIEGYRAKESDESADDYAKYIETYNAYLVAQETAGKIKLAKAADGTYKKNDDGAYVTDHRFDLVANEEKEINLVFRHDDCGYIYQTTVYDNMGTALHIQLADLGWDTEKGESRGKTVFSVYDVQFKDLGAADNPVECDETKHADYEPSIDYEEGETYEAVYTETTDKGNDLDVDNAWSIWYVQDTSWSCGEVVTLDKNLDTENKKLTTTFSAGDNDWSVQIRYKHPNVVAGKTYRLSVVINSDTAYSISINGKSVALKVGENNVEFVWAGGTYGLEINCANPANDDPITLTFSNLKWTELIILNAPVVPSHPADPEVKPVSATTVTGVTLTAEGEKAIFNLAGKVDLAQFDNSVETAKTWLTATHFDLQNLDDGWTSNAFDRVNVTVNADGTFVIKYDITYLAAKNYAYTSHFTAKESTEDGYADNKYRDIKLSEEQAVPGASVTVGGKKYSIKNVVNSGAQADNWGVVSIKVENA